MKTKSMFGRFLSVLVGAGVVLAFAVAAQAVTIEMVAVGDAGNAADTRYSYPSNPNLGGVAYVYDIGKYEVTFAQYCAFLNAVDPDGTNPYGLYRAGHYGTVLDRQGIVFTAGNPSGSKYAVKTHTGDGGVPGSVWGPKPVNWVNVYDGFRFCNWLHNGQPTGGSGLQTGSYDLTGTGAIPDNGMTVTRNPGATWVLPTEDEWYKAAYYKRGGTSAGYWNYPTQSDTAPTPVTSDTTGVGSAGSTGNYANFWGREEGWSRPPSSSPIWYVGTKNGGDLTTVGSNGGPSAYGTHDMAGNCREWTQDTGRHPDEPEGEDWGVHRILRSGDYHYYANMLSANSWDGQASDWEWSMSGLRVVRLPSSGTVLYVR